jgi:hypothetical protein
VELFYVSLLLVATLACGVLATWWLVRIVRSTG